MINSFNPFKKTPKLLEAKTDSLDAFTPTNESVNQNFQTPEEVSAKDQADSAVPLEVPTVETKKFEVPATFKKKRFSLLWPPTKKQLIIVAAIILVIGGGTGYWFTTHHKTKVVVVTKKVAVVKKVIVPVTVPSTLTGLLVNPSVNQGPVTGVMIENSEDARPQSGLSQAGVVFEAIAEGGITRFLALFQDTAPDNVGPIRSARPYFLQWELAFDAGYAHVGGSPEALTDIQNWGVRDLDQFFNSAYYHRVSSRAAPHNVYTAIATLNQLEANKGYTSSTFTGFPRKAETPSKVPTASTINFNISGPTYNVLYQYDATTNSYSRSEGGAPHIDANTGTQIKPKVVIALVMSYSLESDAHHSAYGTIGTGTAYVFQDGNLTIGQWSKSSSTSQFVFTDSAGAVIKLNPGQTWITALGSTADITYAP